MPMALTGILLKRDWSNVTLLIQYPVDLFTADKTVFPDLDLIGWYVVGETELCEQQMLIQRRVDVVIALLV